jgi:hypothetical protein
MIKAPSAPIWHARRPSFCSDVAVDNALTKTLVPVERNEAQPPSWTSGTSLQHTRSPSFFSRLRVPWSCQAADSDSMWMRLLCARFFICRILMLLAARIPTRVSGCPKMGNRFCTMLTPLHSIDSVLRSSRKIYRQASLKIRDALRTCSNTAPSQPSPLVCALMTSWRPPTVSPSAVAEHAQVPAATWAYQHKRWVGANGEGIP